MCSLNQGLAMKKGNIVELSTVTGQNDGRQPEKKPSISEELATAIQELIYRMRHLGPITQ
jgi:hypothetical protein